MLLTAIQLDLQLIENIGGFPIIAACVDVSISRGSNTFPPHSYLNHCIQSKVISQKRRIRSSIMIELC